ncbi:phage infection protein (plasmid) [Clostridium botulinum A2B7 92]|uniref:phage infection protein n=1 Tax=Clostridium botulinum TaxID=1491 RepID=UPI0007E1DD66|nr:phage infection protein [Clostridium botulinum]KEI94094.1 phage infection protein [Clostridium botulinum A2B7 92]
MIKKPNNELNLIYYNAFYNALKEYADTLRKDPKHYEDKTYLLKKVIFYGVKSVNTEEPTAVRKEKEIDNFNLIFVLNDMMALLTPREFVNLFPIKKDFNGHKFCAKDYFYTKDYINKLNQNDPIGNENILDFLWAYTNDDIFEFVMNSMENLNNLRKLNGEPSLMQEFFRKNGIETYTLNTDLNENEHSSNNTDTVLKAKNNRVKHLRIIR